MTYSELILSHGPSNYWKLNESSGLTAVDIVAGANGVISGGVTLGQPGALADGNTAMTFNGTTGYVDVGNVASLAFTTAFTAECWVTFAVDHAPYFLGKNDGPSGQGWALARNVSSGTLRFFAYTGASVAVFDFNSSISHTDLTPWYHIVALWDGTTGASGARIYVNGVQEGSATPGAGTPAVNARRFLLGALDTGPGQSNYLNGSLDEVAIYPRALTPTEISEHYAARLFTAAAHLDLNTDIAGYLGFTAGSDLTTLVSTYLTAHHTGDATKDMKALIDAAT